MANIQPIQNFVLVKFIPKDGSSIIAPDGTRNPTSYCIVQAVGPDVPQPTAERPTVPRLMAGCKVLLRGDAKVFGIEGTNDTAMVPYPVIMAIDNRTEDEEDDDKIEQILQSVN